MAGPDNVLVPMDGSPLSEQALQIALDEYPDAEITVLHVIDPTTPGYSYPMDIDLDREPLHGSEEWYDRSRELAEELFEDVHETVGDREVTTETVVGEPGRQIVAFADKQGIDQIVIGSHGRDPSGPHLLGTVTETVVFRSPVRVLLVR